MRTRSLLLLAATGLSLAACQGADEGNNLQRLDNVIASADIDPAVTRAIEGEIMVDPNLVGSSNANMVRTSEGPLQADYPLNPGAPAGQPAQGGGASQSGNAATPVGNGQSATTQPGSAQSGGAQSGGWPSTRRAVAGPDGPMTGACGRPFEYGPEWAQRMPAEFPAYPGGRLTEAAGNNAAPCRMRVISFQTGDTWQRVLDWYRGNVTRAGFSAEHQQRQGAHVLGGTRGAHAYYLIVRPGGNGSEVDLIVNNGR